MIPWDAGMDGEFGEIEPGRVHLPDGFVVQG